MHIEVTQGDIVHFEADTLVVNLFEGVTQPGGATGAVDRALDGAISDLIAAGDLSGAAGETRVLYPRGVLAARRVIVVGLGASARFDLLAARNAAAHAIRAAYSHKARHVATIVHGGGIGGLEPEAAAQATVEGSRLALHDYDAPRRTNMPQHSLERLSVVEHDAARLPAVEAGVAAAQAICAGVELARDLVFRPANVATPEHLAQAARALAEQHGLTLTVGNRAWAREHNMGAFLAVGQGAGFEPQFIILEYNAERTDLRPIVLVGKGITFDTGGISIKPSAEMEKMKNDMGGAAAVLGALQAIAALQLPLRVVGIAPCTENMPDANSFRPSDVLTASNGTTIEIISTDAEGRLVLADALAYAARYAPQAVIDLATLTGAAARTMGEGIAAALFATDDWLERQLVAAGRRTHERVWPFPLWDDYRAIIASPVADIKNSGGMKGGLGSSAVFLKEFTSYPWAHLDIAGVALRTPERAQAYEQHGATGFGVRLLVDCLRNWQGSA